MSERLKCPECGKWSDVLETRPVRGKNIIYRRRECGNGHRFFSHEVVMGLVKKRNEKTTHTEDQRDSKKQS